MFCFLFWVSRLPGIPDVTDGSRLLGFPARRGWDQGT